MTSMRNMMIKISNCEIGQPLKKTLTLIIGLLIVVGSHAKDLLDPSHIIGIEVIISPKIFDADLYRRSHMVGGEIPENVTLLPTYAIIDGLENIKRVCEHLSKLEEHDWLTHSPYTDSEAFKIWPNGWVVSYEAPGKYAGLSLSIYYDDGRLPDIFWDSHYKSFRNKLFDASREWNDALYFLIEDISKKQDAQYVVEQWKDCKINTDDVEWILFNLMPRNEAKHYDRSKAVYRLTTDFVKFGGVRGCLTDKTKISDFFTMLREMPYQKTNFYSVLESGYQVGFSGSGGVEWTDAANDVLGFITIKRKDKVTPLELIWINDNETIDRDYFNFSFTDDFKKYLDLIYDKSIFDPKPKGIRIPDWGKERLTD